jgi:hypothetical protein
VVGVAGPRRRTLGRIGRFESHPERRPVGAGFLEFEAPTVQFDEVLAQEQPVAVIAGFGRVEQRLANLVRKNSVDGD